MLKAVREHNMTSTQLFILSQKVCQWWNVVFIQSERFFKALNSSHGGTPWDDGEQNSLFVADRMFLIMAIYHAVENLQKLDIELQRNNDNSLQCVLKSIEDVSSWEDLKNLRDMNEHSLDYLVKKGKREDEFRSNVKSGDTETYITAAWTHTNHDTDTILIGKIEIKKLLEVMQSHWIFVRKKTKEVYDKTLFEKELNTE